MHEYSGSRNLLLIKLKPLSHSQVHSNTLFFNNSNKGAAYSEKLDTNFQKNDAIPRNDLTFEHVAGTLKRKVS